MSDLPKGWIECKLGDFVTLRNGYAFKSEDYVSEGIPVVRISDIQDGMVKTDEAVRVNEQNFKVGFNIEKDDVLVAMSGATTGKIGRYVSSEPALQNQRVGNFLPKDPRISRTFVYYWISVHRKDIEDKAYGGAQPNISSKLIEEIDTRLPPLPEQKRIVAKLDTLFAHLDQLKARLEKIPVLLKQFRQAVLTQAVTGRLTEEWRRHGGLDDWKLLKLKDLTIRIEAGKNFSCPEIPVTKETVGLVKISAVTWEKFNPQETKTVTNRNQIQEKYFIKKGDFLISRANTIELVGSSVIVDEIAHDIMISDKVWRVQFNNQETKHFVHWFLKSSIGRKEIESRATGNQMSMRNLSQDSFRDIDIIIPPLEEQKEITRRIESLFTVVGRIEESHKTLQKQINLLPQVVLSKAFRGKLIEV